MENFKKVLIDAVCKEKGIEKIELSYNWISVLKKGNIERKVINNNLDLNSSVSVKLANDKYSTYALLTYYNIPIIEHKILFNEKIMPDCAYINDNFNILKNNNKIVIKANESFRRKRCVCL